MNPIDKFLNNITMYRLVEYGLLAMAIFSLVLSFFKLVSFTPLELLLTFLMVTFVCYFGNILLSKIFRATINSESSLITALILFFLLWPSQDIFQLLLIGAVGLAAMASKFVFAYKKKHIFNPAAIAVVLLAFVGSGASWWIATPLMLPITLIVGLLIVRKIRRFTLLFTFLGTSLTVFFLFVLSKGLNPFGEFATFFTSFPTIFFATIMLTEPLTTPPTRKLQSIYAIIVGILFAWQGPFWPVILTTELALILGNVFSFIVSPKYRLYLHLLSKREIARDTYEFSFQKPDNFKFKPGQYLEWTLPQFKTDGRGNRRYFTIASSPQERELKLGIKFNIPSSSFKEELKNTPSSKIVTASQLTGDFTMPHDRNKKLVFIAGGIGVTPFRSMIQHLIDTNEKRDIIFFYANKAVDEIAYEENFKNAGDVGVKTVYLLSDKDNIPKNWNGEVGRIDDKMLKKYVPDVLERQFYISGPSSMVTAYKKLLKSVGVKPSSITTDYFPGF